jgi:prepilin-type N-terminal cleavage/methylation domain-containing protein
VRSQSRDDRGFTLVELLVVVVILGILAAVTVIGVARFRSDATAAACAADIATVTRAAVSHEAATGDWPADLDVLVSGNHLSDRPSGAYQFDRAARTVTRTPACAAGRSAAATAASGAITGVGGKCVDVTGAGTADGTALQLRSCVGGVGQRWTLPASWPGPVSALGTCMSVAGGSTAEGARVQLSTCDGSPGQQWRADAGLVRHPLSGRCLDAEGGSSTDGTRLIIYSCHGNANQRWTLP